MTLPTARLDVVVADPHPVTRAGLRTVLEDSGAVSVVGEAAEPVAAGDLAETLKPAVVIIDPGLQGVSASLLAWDRLRDLSPRILAYLSSAVQAPVAALVGADSCLHKRADPALLYEVVFRTVRGERLWLPVEDAQAASYDSGAEQFDRLVRQGALTLRERQVLALLLESCSDAEIAERLVVSRNTVKSHVRSVLHALGFPDRRALLRAAAPPRAVA